MLVCGCWQRGSLGFLVLLALLVALSTQSSNAESSKSQVNILLLLPINDTYKFSLSKVLASLNLAISDLKYTDFGSRFNIDLISDTCDCTGIVAPVNAMQNIFGQRNHTKRFQAVFGPMCDYSLAPIARYAPFWNVAVITVGALAQDFRRSKFSEYKTLTNIGPTMYWLDKFVVKVFKRFGWKQVIFLFDKDFQEQDTNSNCYLIMASLKNALLNAQIIVDYKIRDKLDKRPLETILKDYVGIKFSVVCLCGSTNFVHNIIVEANRIGFMNGEYVFINFDLYAQMHNQDRLLQPWKLARKNGNENQTDDISAYQGLLTVTLKVDDSQGGVNSKYQRFQRRLLEHSNGMFKNESEVNFFLASFYDAFNIYIRALNETIVRNGDVNNILEVLKHIWSKNFDGVTGKILIDSHGERMGEFAMHDFDPVTSQFRQVISSSVYENMTDVVLEYDETNRPIYWSSDLVIRNLSDSPKCGFDNSKCPVKEPMPIWVWLLIAMGVLMIIMLTIGIVLYRKAQFEAELNAMNWLIKWEDVNINEKKHVKKVKRRKSLILLDHFDKDKEDNVSLISINISKLNTVYYKRNLCFIKKITKPKIEITRSLLLEVKKLKDMQHDHITRFIGLSLESNRQFIFYEYCQKGSLQDILENQQIELETEFKHHLIHDIIKGMIYIHSSEIKCHGNLTSANCVVDSRFTLKITDFGISMLMAPQFESEEQFYKTQLWRAPELQFPFANTSLGQLYLGTPKGDVYSFAIIIQEILYRKGVFYLNDEDLSRCKLNDSETTSNNSIITKKQIYQQVKSGLRPSLDSDVCSKEIIDLLIKCWSDVAQDRPDFNVISDSMRKTTKISGNILDNLLARMEKYANNLEDLVKERTEACDNERKRAETLLYRLLPPSVASQLMQGNQVQAESFESVSIYFSDICGFTDLSAQSTPMQVVHLLNGLYTLFDSIIENFDVYKVETIGDAYMVVSGLPQRTPNHSCQIARMSLALLDNVESFKIPHLPERRLMLRIGLHTGPCVTGVVGLKMPRYCLFGDTVNTASRMESNGKPLRIHISPEMKESLEKYESFNMELRGPVEMKGKGVITTYWLLGENGHIVDKQVTSGKQMQE